MKKFFSYGLTVMILSLMCSCSPATNTPDANSSEPFEDSTSQYSYSSETSILSDSSDLPENSSSYDSELPNDGHEVITDNHFTGGFQVMGASTATGRTKFSYLDYMGTVDATQSVWEMARWWNPEGFDGETSTEEYLEGNYVYTDSSKVVKVNPDIGYLYLELNASQVYEHTRRNGENWPHLLIEQTFTEKYQIDEAESIMAQLTFTLEKSENKIPSEEYNPDLHAAQLLWYFTLTNRIPPDSDPEEVGTNGDYLWYGVPLYDSRYPEGIDEHYNLDAGFSGSTNKMIYGMSSKDYLPPVEIGQKYQIEIDILPYMRKAFEIAQQNNCLQNVKFENLVFSYMNFGFELPGTFDVACSIEKMSVKVYTK